jgi:uncharacterized protein (UPF0276 family)
VDAAGRGTPSLPRRVGDSTASKDRVRVSAGSAGVGVGLRTAHFGTLLERRAEVDWFEAISENFLMDGGRPHFVLDHVRRDFPVALHGVSLSIGGTDPLSADYLHRLRGLVRRYEPSWVSHNLHDLLPLPWDEEALSHIAARVTEVQDRLGRRIALENVSSYLTFTHSTITEWDFLVELCRRADCEILLDVNNVYVSARNHGFDPKVYLDAVPAERVVQIHLAGHSDLGSHLLDTHDAPVAEAVWDLYRYAVARLGAVPTSIEWDGDVPPLERLEAEAAIVRRIAADATSAEPYGGRQSPAAA